VIVKHPTLPIVRDVPASRVAEWEAAGWIAERDTIRVQSWDGRLDVTGKAVEPGELRPTTKHRRKK
jgi:hypothetical protein